MPKQKTHKGASKRFSLTGTGKVKRKKAFHSHILTKKTTKRKRNMRKSTILDDRDTKGIKRLIPYA
jgi:large subunit ribosomal protein L35